MGSWHATCNISQLPITPGTKVRVLFLTRCPYSMDPGNNLQLTSGDNSRERCYSTDFWHPRNIPIKAVYADYGQVDRIDETSLSYKIFWEQLKEDLMPVEQGENEYHDPPSYQNMSWEHMWDVATEGRLRVSGRHGQFSNDYSDELDADGNRKILKRPKALPVCAVLIREDVYQGMIEAEIMGKQHDYLGFIDEEEADGSKEFKYNQVPINVAYYKSKLETALNKVLVGIEEIHPFTSEDEVSELTKRLMSKIKYDEIARRLFHGSEPIYSSGIKFYWDSLISKITLEELSRTSKQVDELLTEIAEMFYITTCFEGLRKTWYPGTGCGSQGNELMEYFSFHKMITDVLVDEINKNKEFE